MADPRRERDRLRNRNRQLQQELDDAHRVIGWLDASYTAILVELAELAIHPVRRPTDLGGPINNGHAESRPPVILSTRENRAYDLLRKERLEQRRRSQDLRLKYRRLVDGAHADEAPQAGARLC